MKPTKLILALFLVIGFGIITSKAQQGVVSAGGEATGSGETMSFSKGQTDFMHFSSESGSIRFGLQQVLFLKRMNHLLINHSLQLKEQKNSGLPDKNV